MRGKHRRPHADAASDQRRTQPRTARRCDGLTVSEIQPIEGRVADDEDIVICANFALLQSVYNAFALPCIVLL